MDFFSSFLCMLSPSVLSFMSVCLSVSIQSCDVSPVCVLCWAISGEIFSRVFCYAVFMFLMYYRECANTIIIMHGPVTNSFAFS